MGRGLGRRRLALSVGGITVAAGIGAGAVAFADSQGSTQFSDGIGTVSNRLVVTGNGGPAGDGNTGQTLLRLPGFGNFTVTECSFPSTSGPPGPQAAITFTNTTSIPIETYASETVGSGGPVLAPGQSEQVLSGVVPMMLAGGTGPGRRVATVVLGDMTASDTCTFNIQATAQRAG